MTFQEYAEVEYPFFHRELHIKIAQAADNKTLYDVTVDNMGHQASLAYAMPYMIRAAFADFPGKNGQPHRVEIKMDEKQAQ